jgi:hypothetical protein
MSAKKPSGAAQLAEKMFRALRRRREQDADGAPLTVADLADPTAANGTPPDDLFAHVLSANPFMDDRVSGPAAGAVDVDDVHRTAFEQLAFLAGEACAGRRGLGVVLWGEAGVGKSHLLARLARWAAGGNATFVYLNNLRAGPDGLPRSLLRAVVSILTRGRVARFHRTPLFRLVASFAHEAFGYAPAARLHWHQIGRACARLLDREAADGGHATPVDRAAYGVLLRFFQSAYAARDGTDDGAAALAVRWLGGDDLDPSEAARLPLPPAPARDEPVGLGDNQQVQQVLVALTRLALSARQPFVLGFDQVDDLDDGQMAALAHFLEALIDAAPNLLVVTAGARATLLHWHQARAIPDSAWGRIAQFEVGLRRVSPAEAGRIVAARLAHFFEPFRGRPALPQDPLFPLGVTWRQRALGDTVELRPRDVLNRACAAFRREQEVLILEGGPAWLTTWGRPPGPPSEETAAPDDVRRAIDRRVARQVEEHRAQCRARPEALPPDAHHLAGLVGALLEQCRAQGRGYAIEAVERPDVAKAGAPPAYDLLLRRRAGDGGEEQSWLLFVVTASGLSATGSLRRLVEAAEPPERVFLLTDQRRPLLLGPEGQKYLRQLHEGRAGQFRHVELTFADCAELDALRAAVGLARAGDLEAEVPAGKFWPLIAVEVAESLHRQGCYRAAPLLRDLLAEMKPALDTAAAPRENRHTWPV